MASTSNLSSSGTNGHKDLQCAVFLASAIAIPGFPDVPVSDYLYIYAGFLGWHHTTSVQFTAHFPVAIKQGEIGTARWLIASLSTSVAVKHMLVLRLSADLMKVRAKRKSWVEIKAVVVDLILQDTDIPICRKIQYLSVYYGVVARGRRIYVFYPTR
ncbi:hypothetical protein B0H19DRAFT_1068636 [Mycena capillaripes]|nr:hypothetical protein B0H19DRAFT_1068636 [Mycena capillaripes]